MDLARSRQIWRDLAAFRSIPMIIGFTRNQPPPAGQTDKSVTITGWLQVEKPPIQSCTGQLQVGQKPDLPDL